MMKMVKWMLVAITLWVALAMVSATVDSSDVANGWYQQLPRVTRQMAEARVACIADALRADGITVTGWSITALPAGPRMPGESGFAPSTVNWEMSDGYTWTSDATLTALFPEAAYVEIVRQWNKAARRNAVRCGNPGDSVISVNESPLKRAVDCPEGVTGPVCYEASGAPPLEFVDTTGRKWRQIYTGYLMWRKHYWVP